jgi:hypothetical protein
MLKSESAGFQCIQRLQLKIDATAFMFYFQSCRSYSTVSGVGVTDQYGEELIANLA